jgi:DNA-binding NtrC family response regulator
MTLEIPPLRERRGDIPVLARSYVAEISRRIGKEVKTLSAGALEALTRYSWPGNVRELINVIERAILLCEGNVVTANDLPIELSPTRVEDPKGEFAFPTTWSSISLQEEWLDKPLGEFRRMMVAQLEGAYLAGLLEQTQGRIGETAKRAGIEPRSLHGKMKKYGLRKEDFKRGTVK